jgi:hypothetical protein
MVGEMYVVSVLIFLCLLFGFFFPFFLGVFQTVYDSGGDGGCSVNSL